MACEYTRDELLEQLNENFFDNPNCFYKGKRNDDAVDFCIITWCLGLNPIDEFNKLVVRHGWSIMQAGFARNHVCRVVPYLNKWGAKNTMEAMAYAINY